MFSVSKLDTYPNLLIYWFSLAAGFELRNECATALTQTEHLRLPARALIGEPDLKVGPPRKPGRVFRPFDQPQTVVKFGPAQVAKLLFPGYPI